MAEKNHQVQAIFFSQEVIPEERNVEKLVRECRLGQKDRKQKVCGKRTALPTSI